MAASDKLKKIKRSSETREKPTMTLPEFLDNLPEYPCPVVPGETFCSICFKINHDVAIVCPVFAKAPGRKEERQIEKEIEQFSMIETVVESPVSRPLEDIVPIDIVPIVDDGVDVIQIVEEEGEAVDFESQEEEEDWGDDWGDDEDWSDEDEGEPGEVEVTPEVVPEDEEAPVEVAPIAEGDAEVPVEVAPIADEEAEVPVEVAPIADVEAEVPVEVAPIADVEPEAPVEVAPIADEEPEAPVEVKPEPPVPAPEPAKAPKPEIKEEITYDLPQENEEPPRLFLSVNGSIPSIGGEEPAAPVEPAKVGEGPIEVTAEIAPEVMAEAEITAEVTAVAEDDVTAEAVVTAEVEGEMMTDAEVTPIPVIAEEAAVEVTVEPMEEAHTGPGPDQQISPKDMKMQLKEEAKQKKMEDKLKKKKAKEFKKKRKKK